MYCKLIDAIDTPQMLNLASTKEVNGRKIVKYTPTRFFPGKKYEVPDDGLFLDTVKNYTRKVTYSKEVEDALKKCGATYEVKMCKSCGGRVKKIEYQVLEVVE